MKFEKHISRASVLFGTILAVGSLASFAGSGDNPQVEKSRFLANCPGGQNVLLSKNNDHRVDLVCADDGTAPRIIPMSKEWNDDEPQELINNVVMNYPGRVMIELSTDIDGASITTNSNTGFYIEDGAYSPSSITMQNPLEDTTTYVPNLSD